MQRRLFADLWVIEMVYFNAVIKTPQATTKTTIRRSHQQCLRCYNSNLLAEAASTASLSLVRKAYAQLWITIRAMSRRKRGGSWNV